MWTVSGGSPSNVTFVSWEAQPNTRGTFGILYSCILTIVLCVWKVVHLNIPDPNEDDGPNHSYCLEFWRGYGHLFRKIRYGVVGVLMPEAVC